MSLQLVKAARMHAEGELERAKTNILVYMNQSVGIGEHSDIVEAIQEELDKMAMAEDRIEMLNKHFTSLAQAKEFLQEDDGAQFNINFNE
jgi:RIO-like serine/threonine protein kinase